MPIVDTDDLISVSEANRLGVSGLIRDAEKGHDRVVLRNNKPVAAVVGMDRLARLEELLDDSIDISLATARMLTAGDERVSLDDVLHRLGVTRDQLRDLPD